MDDISFFVFVLILALGGIYAATIYSPWRNFAKSPRSRGKRKDVVFQVRWSPYLEKLSGLKRVKALKQLRKILFFVVILVLSFLAIRFGIAFRVLRLFLMAERFAPVFILSLAGLAIAVWYAYKRITKVDSTSLKGLENREYFSFEIAGVTETFPLIDVLQRQVESCNRVTQVLDKFASSGLRTRLDQYCVELLFLNVRTIERKMRSGRRCKIEMFPKDVALCILDFPHFATQIESIAADPESASAQDTCQRLQNLVEKKIAIVRQGAEELKDERQADVLLWISHMDREIGFSI